MVIYSSMPISQPWKHPEVTFGAEKDHEKSALNWHKPIFTYSLYSIESRLVGIHCEPFVGREKVCSRQKTCGNETLNNCQSWPASAEKQFGSIRGYQCLSPQFNYFRESQGLPTFFPLVPSNESISSPGTSSWSSFISFDSFSASFPPRSFFSPI